MELGSILDVLTGVRNIMTKENPIVRTVAG
jgi:hypothetical protein